MRPQQFLNLVIYYALFFVGLAMMIMYLAEVDGIIFLVYFAGMLLAFLLYINWQRFSFLASNGGRKRRRRSTQ